VYSLLKLLREMKLFHNENIYDQIPQGIYIAFGNEVSFTSVFVSYSVGYDLGGSYVV